MTNRVDSQVSYDRAARWSDIFDAFERRLALQLRVAAPCRVLSYDAAAQTVKVELGDRPVIRTEAGERVLDPIVIDPVPVMVHGHATSYAIPAISPGVTGLLLATDRALEQWLGANGAAVDPLYRQTHSYTDCVFLFGLSPASNRISPAPPTTAYTIESALIHVGFGAAQSAVLGDLFRTLHNANVIAYNAHTHTIPSGTSGPPSGPMSVMTASELSTKVKIGA